MRTNLLITISFICVISFTYANNRVDSLINIINNTENDSVKIQVYFNLYTEYKASFPDTAMQYAQKALELSELTNFNYGVFSSNYFIGILNYRKGNFNLSKQYFLEALEAAEKEKESRPRSKVLNALGMISSTQGDLAGAKKYYLQSVDICIENKDSSGMAAGYNNLGAFMGNIGAYDEAAVYFKKSIDIYKLLGKEEEIVTGLLDLGIIEKYQSRYKSALQYLFQAQTLAEHIGNIDLTAYIYSTIGSVYKQLGEYQQAIHYYQESQQLGKELGDKSLNAELLNKIGNIHELQNDYNLAIKYYTESLILHKVIGEKLLVPSIMLDLASAYIKTDSIQKAERFIEDAIVKAQFQEQKAVIGRAYCLLGIVVQKQHNFSHAIKYLILASNIHKELGEEDQLAKDLFQIGTVYYDQGQLSEALNYFLQAHEISKRIGSKDTFKEIVQWLSKTYNTLGDYKNAYAYHVEYKQVYDSLFSIENNRSIQAMESRFELKRKEQQIALQETQLANQKLIIRQKELWQKLLIFGIFGIVMVVFLILWNYRKLRKANQEIVIQKEEISAQQDALLNHNQKITNSINYARRIQNAVLPTKEQMQSMLHEHFVLFKPCDIVSGDFYWVNEIQNKTIVVVADCTGHGVPGAFMSMLGLSFLKEINSCSEKVDAAFILEDLREKVKQNLQQNSESTQWDGMDMGICIVDKATMEMQYAGAHNALVMIRDKEQQIIKGNKQPVSLYLKETCFDNHHIRLKHNDTFYLYTDGYADQFGGSDGKKFFSKRLNNLLLKIHNKTMQEQKSILMDTHTQWKKDSEQNDDVLILGFKITNK